MQSIQSLPSLNALRVFEAVARHLSFTKAADELHVTPGAVSHQIAALEDLLGIALFRRDGRSIALTPAAETCLPTLTTGINALREAMRLVQADRADRVLTVSVAPAFASRWLLPRLSRFTEAHPDIQLQLSTGLGLIDAVRPEASASLGEKPYDGTSSDLTIRYGRGMHAASRADRLFETAVTPVCSPRLATGAHPLRTPDDLRHHVLLHDDTAYFDDGRADWKVWLAAAGVTAVNAARGPRFSHSALSLDAAADGLGVALGISLLAAHDVDAGRLIMPFELQLPSPYSYYVVYPEAGATRPELMAFRDWLLDEARQTTRRAS